MKYSDQRAILCLVSILMSPNPWLANNLCLLSCGPRIVTNRTDLDVTDLTVSVWFDWFKKNKPLKTYR